MAHERIYIVEPRPETRPEGAWYMQFKLDTHDDDYPPAEWEALWVRPEPEPRTYRVLSIPAFITGIAVNDLVLAKLGPQDNIGFDRKIASGGHSTIRIFLNSSDPNDNDVLLDDDLIDQRIESIIDEVQSAGCSVQRTGWDLIIAVDIPSEETFVRLYEDCLIPRGDANELTVESACMIFGSAPDAWPSSESAEPSPG